MKEEKKLVPKLRFPEFRGAGEWNTDALGKVADFVNEKIPFERVAVENYVSTENILSDFGGVARASKLPTTGSVTRYRPNDTLVSNIRPYLKKVWVADKEGGASNDVIVIRAKQGLQPEYLSYLLKNDAFIGYVMTGAKGVKMPRGDVGSMKAYPTLYPAKAEQQKLADCLSSLDELIAAQARKVDALKTHKKGLMQQLFPREGETQPRLRFPEFRDTGEWLENTLGNLVEIRSGNSPSHYQLIQDGKFPFVKVEDLNNCEKHQRVARGYCNDPYGLVPSNSVIFPKRGAAIALNKVRLSKREILMDTNMMALTPIDGYQADFLFHYLSQIGLDRIADSSTIPQINNKHIIPLPVLVPLLEEQQCIADCLTSLDDLITAATQELETLKTHKKGLMQQLFPLAEAA